MQRLALGVFGAVLLAAGCSNDGTLHDAEGHFRPSLGVSMEFDVRFPEDRTAIGGHVLVDGTEYPVGFYVNDGDRFGVPLDVPAGTALTVSALVQPACAARGGTPPGIVVATALTNGQAQSASVRLSNPEEFAEAGSTWCAGGVTAHLDGYGEAPDGAIGLLITVGNPGPESVTIEAEEYDGPDDRWDATTIEVGPREIEQMTISGMLRTQTGGFAAPWDLGLLQVVDADGGRTPLAVTED